MPVLAVLLAACGTGDDEPAATTEDTSGSETSGDAEASATAATATSATATGASTDPTDAAETGTSEASDDTAASGGPFAPGCDEAEIGDYARCLENGQSNPSQCGWMGDDFVEVNCIQAALVEGGSVCSIIGCVDRCDCFAPPPTGTATVECMEGVIENGPACVLHCGNGETCPDGMQCSYNICVWPPA